MVQTGAQQLLDWMKRRGFSKMDTAAHFGWDLTFISKLVNSRRLPGLVNAIKIERETGIPVEAWLPTRLDTDAEPVVLAHANRQ